MTHSAFNYDGYHVGRWKAGQRPLITKTLAIVIHDQRSDAYIINFDDTYDFQEWVCGDLFEDYDLETEEPVEFLEHNDVYIKFRNLGDYA
jgi:hypothetical protein